MSMTFEPFSKIIDTQKFPGKIFPRERKEKLSF